MKRFLLSLITICCLASASLVIGQTSFSYRQTEIRSTPWISGGTLGAWSGDIDGDGFFDVIVGGGSFPPDLPFSAEFRILINDGNGFFADKTGSIISSPVPVANMPREFVIADFNGDDRPDIFVACHGYDAPPFPGEPNVLLLSTVDNRLFDASSSLPAYNDFSHSVAVGDIDDDGDIDIYVGNLYGQDNILPYLLLNDGSGGFTENSSRLPGSLSLIKYTASALADMNNDGSVDLILGGWSADKNASMIFYNDGTGNFTDLQSRALPVGPFGAENETNVDVIPIDLNADGRLDILQSQGVDPSGRSIQILIQLEDGSFTDESSSRITDNPPYDPNGGAFSFLVPIDFDGDGATDILCQLSHTSSLDEPIILLNDGTGYFSTLNRGQIFEGIQSWTYADVVGIPKSQNEQINFLALWQWPSETELYFSTWIPANGDGGDGGGG